MKTSTQIKSLSLILISLSLGVATHASARDSKSYSGTECVAQFPLIDAEEIFYTSEGHVSNFDDNTAVVVCPAIRDTSGSVSAEVMLRDRNSQQDISCDLVSTSREGILLDRLTAKSNSTFNTFLPIDFGQVRARAERNSTISIVCRIPGTDRGLSSSIAGYTINEHD